MEERPHERRFPGAARTPEKDVVRGEAGEELPGVLLHHPFLLLDAEQVFEEEVFDVSDRFEVSGERALPPVCGDALHPVDPGHGARQQRLEGGKHTFQLRGKFRVKFHGGSWDLDLFAQRGDVPANRGDFRTSSSASAESSSLRSGASARSHRCGIAASPYRAPAIAPAMDPVVSASPPPFTVFTTHLSLIHIEKKASNTVR